MIVIFGRVTDDLVSGGMKTKPTTFAIYIGIENIDIYFFDPECRK